MSRFREFPRLFIPLLLELRDASSQRRELSLGFRVLVANRVAVTANLVQNDRKRLDRASLFLAGAIGLGRLHPRVLARMFRCLGERRSRFGNLSRERVAISF